MKKLLRKLKNINLLIRETERAIETAPQLPYYKIFGGNDELERDLLQFNTKLKDLLSTKFALLETLELKIRCIKTNLSEKERNVTIGKNLIAASHG